MERSTTATLVLAAWIPLAACALEPYEATGHLSVEDFSSDVVGDDYVLRIRVPPDYDPEAAELYPLIIQLDPTFAGLEEFDITVGLVSHHAAQDRWPEAIVVGVDYHDPSLRERDYLPPDPPDPAFQSGNADEFYAMLEDELLPYLESEHAIDPERRYLVGHSNGGVFAWYAAFRHDPSLGPPLFAGIVAADSGYIEPLFHYEQWHAERSDDLPMRIFATRSVYNGAIQKVTFEAMMDRLRDHGYPGLELKTRVLETDHGGAIWPSFEQGLSYLLAGDGS